MSLLQDRLLQFKTTVLSFLHKKLFHFNSYFFAMWPKMRKIMEMLNEGGFIGSSEVFTPNFKAVIPLYLNQTVLVLATTCK